MQLIQTMFTFSFVAKKKNLEKQTSGVNIFFT